MAEFRALTAKLQEMLATLPDVAEVRVTRTGAKMLRTVTQEEAL